MIRRGSKVLVACSMVWTCMVLVTVATVPTGAHADQGWNFDLTFADHGRIRLANAPSGSPPADAAAQPDGSFVVLFKDSTDTARVRRYTATGQLDTGFATDGDLELPGLNTPVAWDIDAADTLEFLIPTAAEGTYTLLRYTADGQPDTSFSEDGALPIVFTGGSSWNGVKLAVDDAGITTIVATGMSTSAVTTIVRRTADGSPDASFDGDGTASFTAFTGSLIDANATGIYLISGYPSGYPGVIGRINSTGVLDMGYGTNGFAQLAGLDAVGTMLLEPDGSVVIASQEYPDGTEAITVQRLTPLGKLDPAFAQGGRVTVGFAGMHPGTTSSGPVAEPIDIVHLDATHLVVFCNTIAGAAVAAVTTSGTVDTSFGDLGRAYLPSGFGVAARIVAMQGLVAADGALVVVGHDTVDTFLQRSVDNDQWVGQPAAPTNLVASVVTESASVGISASWTPAESTPLATVTSHHYRLRRNADGAYLVDGVVFGTSWTNLGLRPGEYTVSVWAETAYGDGAVASTIVVVPPWSPTIHMVPPARLMDTRATGTTIDHQAERIGMRGAGTTTRLRVGGRAGLATNAIAAVLNITVTQPISGGYVTAYPCNATRPNASIINFRPGVTIANTAYVRLDGAGDICLFTSASTHLIVDVSGDLGRSGGYVPVTPARLVDTRPYRLTVDHIDEGMGRGDPGWTWRFTVAGRANIPLNATAALVTLTVVEPYGAGYLTAYPCDAQRPNASTVNHDVLQTVSNSAIVPLDGNGSFCVFTLANVHLIVDVSGALTTDSNYVPLRPARLMDTRPTGNTVDQQFQRIGLRQTGSTTVLHVAGRGGVPSRPLAAVLNIIVVPQMVGGYVTVYPCNVPRPKTSTVGIPPGEVVSNNATVQVDPNGDICIFTSAPTHVVVDTTGVFPVGGS